MRRFYLSRKVDVSGISGIGIVAEGVEFSDGRVVVRWLTPNMETIPTTVIHDNIESVRKLHGHDGSTDIIFRDE